MDNSVIFDAKFGGNLNEEQCDELRSAIIQYEGSFNDAPGRIKDFEYEMKMRNGIRPKNSLPYKIPFHLKDQVDEEIKRWLDLGIIRKSSSEWSSTCVIVIICVSNGLQGPHFLYHPLLFQYLCTTHKQSL